MQGKLLHLGGAELLPVGLPEVVGVPDVVGGGAPVAVARALLDVPRRRRQHWTKMTSPMLSNRGSLAYDKVDHVLYSTNLGAGVWRVVTP